MAIRMKIPGPIQSLAPSTLPIAIAAALLSPMRVPFNGRLKLVRTTALKQLAPSRFQTKLWTARVALIGPTPLQTTLLPIR